jgi:hypothetical protein
MATKYTCVNAKCRKQVTATKNDRYRSHTDGSGELCEMASAPIPEHVLAQPAGADDAPDVPQQGVDYQVCPQCERKVQLTRLGYFEPHDQTLRGGDRCPVSGVRAKHAKRREDVLLPGDAKPKPGAEIPKIKDSSTISSAPTSVSAGAAESPTAGSTAAPGAPTTGAVAIAEPTTNEASPTPSSGTPADPPPETAEWRGEHGPESVPLTPSPESTDTSNPSPGPEPSPSPTGPFSLGTSFSALFLQPFSPFLQPPEWIPPVLVFLQPPAYEGPAKGEPMGDLAKELATKIKETFYSYSNRKTTDNRSAQTTLGPSEIGTPCDRRLAMALMGVPPVNPGGDGWAAFVGTCTHVGMAEVYTFADAGTGRYAVELPVFLGMPSVPRGTTDLLDRRDGTVVDWKIMGAYSLKKFKAEGPSLTYRTQAHVYGLGAERGGEKVKNVAVVGLPRAGSSLDEMHVWTEKYDRKFAQAALDRVARIAGEITASNTEAGLDIQEHSMRRARRFETGDDCRYCPFHLPKDEEMKRGCPGK